MFPFSTLVETGLKSCDDKAPVIASMEEIPLPQLASLCRDNQIAGAILRENAALSADVLKKGVWTDQLGGRWQIERSDSSEILFFGYRWNIGLHMLLSAYKAGYRKIIHLQDDGVSFESLIIQSSLVSNGLGRAYNRFIASFQKLGFLSPIGEYLGRGGFDKAYDEMVSQLEDLTPQLSKDEFVKDKVMMHIGSLGPGGAERQLSYAACGLHADKKREIIVAVDYLNNDTNRFHLPKLKKAGIRVQETPNAHEDVMETPEDSQLYSFFINNYRHTGFQNLMYKVLAYTKLLREEKPEIVHCWMDASNVMFGIAASVVGVPKIILSCRSAAPDNFEIFQPYMKPGYSKLMDRHSVTFLNNSEAGARDYARWLKQEPDFQKVIHNGFEFPKFTRAHNGQTIRKKLGIPKEAPVLGSIIRFSEEKRPELMIKAIAAVIKEKPETYGLIYGNGVMHGEMVKLVKNMGLEDKVLLPGYTSDAWKSLGALDIFLLTSRMEGLPNVLIEAQIMGLPVVTTGKGGMPETYIEGETGLTAQRETPASLAEACLSILEDPEKRRQMSAEAALQAQKRFSLQHMVDLLRETYDTA